MANEPLVNVVDEITLCVALAVVISMMILRRWRGLKVLDSAQVAADLLNGITLVPFAMLTTTVFYPKILEEVAKYPLFVSVAGVLAIIRVIAELFKPVEADSE